MNILSRLKDLFDLEPNENKLYMKFWCQNYRYISGSEIKTIVSLVFKEFRARNRDLYLGQNDVENEISFWLTEFENNKGIDGFSNKFTRGLAKEYLINRRKVYFSKEINSRLNLKASDEYLKHLSDVEDVFIEYIFHLDSI